MTLTKKDQVLEFLNTKVKSYDEDLYKDDPMQIIGPSRYETTLY